MRTLILAPLAALAFFAAGCTHPLRPTGYLPETATFDSVDTKIMQVGTAQPQDLSIDANFLTKNELRALAEEGKPVPDLAGLGLDMNSVQPTLFIVNETQWLAGEVNLNEAERQDILFTVRERMYRYLLREYPHPVRVRYAYVENDPLVVGYRVLSLDTAVTHVKTGWGPARYFLGYGAGGTVIQLEGKFYEMPETEQPMAWFRVREDHGGYPMGFLNPRVFSATYCLKYASDKVIKKFTDDIRATIPGFRPRPVGAPTIDKHLAGSLALPPKYHLRGDEWPFREGDPPKAESAGDK